jgi:glycosyltransferase involved in cell wall biosynthesis
MMNLLLIANIASHYRSAIYSLIDRELGADFVFGDKEQDIHPMDYSQLTGMVTIVHNVHFWHGYYQRGVMKYLFKDYDTYLVTGEFRNLTVWLLLFGLKLMPKKRAFLWSHGWLGKEEGLKRVITKQFFRLADGIFVYNNRSRLLMIEGGVDSQKLTTIYNSLDYNKQLSIRNKLVHSDIYHHHFGNRNHTIIFIGRLTAIKRVDWILEAIYNLSVRGGKYNVVLVGDGAEKERLEKIVKEKSLSDSVWLYGSSYDEERNAELLFNADLCVSPGNVGLTAIHAMMYGCPVITNDDFDHQMPEHEAIIIGETGDFFHNGDMNSLTDAISRWFHSPDYHRENIRQACYHEIDSKWTPDNQINILKSFLLNADQHER